MKNKKVWLVLLVLPLLMANYVWAQGIPTGTLNGRVGDDTGAGLPGVSVTATSPALQGSRTTVTNVNGDYNIPNVPPGDYTVTIALSGFQTVTRTTNVPSGQQVAVNVKLAMAGVATGVTVVAQSAAVSQGSQASTTYSTELMDKLPVARTILGSVTLTPGVNQNGPAGNVTISGGQSFDNVFTVNGVNIQDNVRGTPTNLFIEDAIQETTTMTSGVSAEYGRFTGGVINAVTKRGGNAFSGSIRATLNNDNNKARDPDPHDLHRQVGPHVRGHPRRPDLAGQDLVFRRRPLQQAGDVGIYGLDQRRAHDLDPADEPGRARRREADDLAVPEPHPHGVLPLDDGRGE